MPARQALDALRDPLAIVISGYPSEEQATVERQRSGAGRAGARNLHASSRVALAVRAEAAGAEVAPAPEDGARVGDRTGREPGVQEVDGEASELAPQSRQPAQRRVPRQMKSVLRIS